MDRQRMRGYLWSSIPEEPKPLPEDFRACHIRKTPCSQRCGILSTLKCGLCPTLTLPSEQCERRGNADALLSPVALKGEDPLQLK